MNSASARQVLAYARRTLGLDEYLRHPGDGRVRPQISPFDLVWALLMAQILRLSSFLGVEALVRSRVRRSLGLSRSFGDDALRYFVERLGLNPLRQALTQVLRRAKRGKAFAASSWIGFAIDGTTAGRCKDSRCGFCHPVFDADGLVHGHHHLLCMIAALGGPVPLPFDVEPWKVRDSELQAGQRLLRRAVEQLGPRFADYVVADAKFAGAPFLHVAGELGLRAIVRLKANLPELSEAAIRRFQSTAPTHTFVHRGERIEAWDADDFDPWENLTWKTVRVLRYLQHKTDGTVVEAYWLTDFPSSHVDTKTLYLLAKGRWGIENEGFNDAKNRHGFEHLPRHEEHSILVIWLLTLLAIVIERLYRERYLHRGSRRPPTAIEFVRDLLFGLASQLRLDSS